MSLGEPAPSADVSSAAEPSTNDNKDKDDKSKQLAVSLTDARQQQTKQMTLAGAVRGAITAYICSTVAFR